MVSASPKITLVEGPSLAPVSFTEDSSPVALAQNATFTSQIADFNGLSLSAVVIGGLAEDQLTVISTNGHIVQAQNSQLLVDGVIVGTVAGGANGMQLSLTFNETASVGDANIVLNALAYVNTNTAAPNTTDRTVYLTLFDQKGVIAQQSLTVDVIAQNDAPILIPSTDSLPGVNENGSKIITFADLQKICSVTDPDGDTLSFKIMSIGSGMVMVDGVTAVAGTTIITPTSKVEWYPAPNVTGQADGFSVAAFDGQTESKAWGQVRAIIADVDPVLTAPTSVSVKGALAGGTTIVPINVAADGNGLIFSIIGVSQDTGVLGADGKPVMKTVDAGLGVMSNGTIYVADANKFATFTNSTLVVSVGVDDEDADNALDSQVSIRLSIGDGNEPPVGAPTAALAAGTEDVPYKVWATSLLSGFSDPEKGTLKVQGLTADHGAVTNNGDGSFTITPEKDFNGQLTLTYAVADPAGKTLDNQHQTVTFAAVEDAPEIQAPATLTGQEGHSLTLTYAELLKVAPVSDAESDPVSYKVMALGSGTLTVDGVAAVAGETLIGAGATLVWTPVANTIGVVEAFSLAATDGALVSTATVPVRIDLTDINPSLEGPNVVALTENSPKGTVVAKYTTTGDTDGLTFGFEVKDENDQPLPPNVVDGKAISADGAFAIDIKTGVVTVYDASKLDFETKSSFDLRVTVDDEDADTAADSAIRLTVYLANANDAPTIKDLGTVLAGAEGQTLSLSGSKLFTLAEMADQDKDALSFQVASLGSGTLLVNGVAAVAGTTLINTESVVSWTPAANATGVIEAFSLAAYDGKLASTNAVPVKVNVADVNPVLTGPNAVILDENTPAGTVVAQVQVSGDKDGLIFGFSTGNGGAAVVKAEAASKGWSTDVVETPVASSGKAISADGAFAIDIHTGEITVNDPSKLDFETHPTFNLTVTVDDEDADSQPDSTLSLTIKLNDVNDAPVITGHDVMFKGQEGHEVALTFADLLKLASLSDQDLDIVNFQVAALGSGTLTVNGDVAVAGTTLITPDSVVVWTPAANATGVIEAFSLAAYDGDLASTAKVVVKVDVADVDPVLTGATTFTLAENSAAGTEVARMAVSGDQDGLTFGFADATKIVDGKAISADGAFAIDIKTGIVTVNDASKLDFETNPTLKLAVTVDDEDADTTADSTLALVINLTDVNEAPVIKDLASPLDGFEGKAVVLSYESLLKAAAVSDPDGDTVSYKVMALNAGTLTVDGVEAVAGETLITASSVVTWTPPANTTGKLDAFTLAAFDGKLTSDVAVPVLVNVADVNPVLTGPTAVSLAENSVEGTVVARMDVSDDKDGLTFGFLFAGKVEGGKAFTPDGVFAIDTKTGVITVNDASKLDFETHPVFNLNVTVDDEDADTTVDSILKVAINLTDVNEKPVIEAREATWTGVEGQPISLTYADLLKFASVSDPDKDVLSFKVASLGAGTLVVDGVVAVAGETIITEKSAVVWTPADNTTGSMEAFALAAFDGKLASDASIPVRFTVVDLDPRLVGPTTFSLAENSAAGTVVAEMAVTRDTDGLTYGFVGGVKEQLAGGGETAAAAAAAAPVFTGKVISADGAFAIDMKTGIVTVHDASKLDFEANPSFKLTVTVDDEDADTLPDNTLDLTINLTDVNEAPVIKDLASPLDGFEGKAVVLSYESLLKAAAVSDPDGDAVSYKVMALNAGTLTVDGVDAVAGETLITASSVVTWTPPANTTGTVGAFTLAAFDGTLTSATTVPVQVAIADEKPVLTGPAVFTLAENSGVGTEVAKLAISGDQDGLTFGFADAGKTEDGKVISADGAFAIDMKTGIVTVHDASKLDFETNPSFKLTVTVDDEDADTLPDSTLDLAINLTDVNEAPVIKDLASPLDGFEGKAVVLSYESLLKAAGVSDPDGDSVSYKVMALNAGTLTVDGIDAVAGETLITASSVVSWTPPANTTGTVGAFTLAAFDGTLTSATTVPVQVAIADEKPVLTGPAVLTLAENSGVGTEVAKLAISGDQDGLTFGFADAGKTEDGKVISADGAFAIDMKTGIVTVHDASKLDFETNPSFKLTVTVDDEDADTLPDSTLDLAINLTNVNEAPVLSGLPATAIAVTTGQALTLPAFTVTDPDSTLFTVTLSAVNGTLGGLLDADAGTAGIQLFGTAADIQAMLALSTFTPTVDGEARVDLTVSDGAGGIATGSLPFLVSTPSGSTVAIGDAIVTTKTETQADGTLKQTVTVPVVADTDGTHVPADIPLVKDNADILLSATLPTGVGLTATGAATPQTTEQSLQELIAQINQHTPDGSAEQSQLADGGAGFLKSLPTDAVLVLQTVVLTGIDTFPAGASIVLSAPAGTAPVALVVDASALPAGTPINFENVAFAAVVGPVTLGGGSGAQVVYADDAAQTIVLGAGNDELHAGGGNDIVGSAGGDDRIFGEAGDDIVFGGPGRDLLHGGLGTDTARFDGNRADYEILQDRGVTVVRSLADPTDVDTLVNVESLSFADGKVDLTVPDAVSWIAALYSKVLGRQADLAGIQHYAGLVERGVSAGDIAIAFLTSPEAIAKGTGAAAGDLSVEQLYRTLFGREPDADGLAYHKAQLAAGVTLAEVAAHFVHAPEMQAHLPTADALDFTVGDVTAGLVTGTAAAETLQGGALDDTLISNGGADVIDGRTGDDTAVFAGNRADYAITQEGVHWTIKAATAPAAEPSAVLVNVEHVQFADMTIDLTPHSDLGWIGALYTQVLGRQGDEGGLMAHLADYQGGMSKGAVALSFMISPEAVAAGHGATSAKDLTADMVYQALLGHAATEADHAAYGAVENDPASLAAALMDSTEMQAHVLQQKDMDFFI